MRGSTFTMTMPADNARRPLGIEHSAPILFIHGFGLDARMWRRQVDAFQSTHRVLTIDLPGFGLQGRDAGVVCPADEVARVLDRCGLLRAHIVGSSIGGTVAIDFALKFPKSVASLALVGPILLRRPTGLDTWSQCATFANEGDKMTAAETWLGDPLFDGVRRDDDLFEEVRQIALDYGGAHWRGRITNQWHVPVPHPHLGEIAVPALVVTGELDTPAFQNMADALAAGLPRGRRQKLAGSGHLPNVETPAAFNQCLRAFLEGEAAPTSTR